MSTTLRFPITRPPLLAALWVVCVCVCTGAAAKDAGGTFTIRDVLSAPFLSELHASPTGNMAAWLANDRGSRNIWVADVSGDGSRGARQLTGYTGDDGVDMGELRWTPAADAVVYTRGGSLEGGGPINALSLPGGAVAQEIWVVPTSGAAPRKLGAGHSAEVSPAGDRVAFIADDQIWLTSLSKTAEPAQLIHDRGKCRSLTWSPDGRRLAFVSDRGDHAFIGVYDFTGRNIAWMSPSIDADDSPTWSRDSMQVAFIRSPSNNPYMFAPRLSGEPWSIWIANANDGTARRIWSADAGTGSVFFPLESDRQLLWSSSGKLIFPWEKSGWRNLYSISTKSGAVEPLTPGAFEVIGAALAADGGEVVYSANAGDLDGRHLWRLSVASRAVTPLTSGKSIEDSPEVSGGGRILAMRADARKPIEPVFIDAGGKSRDLAPPPPPGFPLAQLVEPQNVVLTSPDGLQVHGQLFLPAGPKDGSPHPAIVFFHGGPTRQMFAAWNPMDAYSYMYGLNQYFANKGYLVLSVNYRGGSGYGLKFRESPNLGTAGSSEYQDILGAAQYLRARADVDARRIGVYRGSYGGLMTALALSRSSDLYAAGVDYAGVHDWTGLVPGLGRTSGSDAAKLAYESSAISTAAKWRSPVLFVHSDDDRDVPFAQTVDLINALRTQGQVQIDQLVIPNEIHDLIRGKSWETFFDATDRFFDEHLRANGAGR